MITQRTQYRFVTPPGGVLVNGGILPARDAAGGGTSGELRGEDLCFLAEAGCRARAYRTYGVPQSIPIAAENILAASINNAAELIRAYPSHNYGSTAYCIAGTPDFPSQYVKDAWGTDDSFPSDIIPNIVSNPVSQFIPDTPANPVLTGDGLSADAIRRMYYDIRKNGCYVFSVDNGLGRTFDGTPTLSTTEYRWNSSTSAWSLYSQSTTETSSPFGVLLISKNNSGMGDGHFQEDNWTITALPPSGEGTMTPTPLAPLSGEGVACFAVFGVTIQGYSLFGTHYDAMIVEGEINSSGVVEITPLTAAGVRYAVAGARELPITWGTAPNGTVLTVNCFPIMVIFHDPGIDTSGINWNWTPA